MHSVIILHKVTWSHYSGIQKLWTRLISEIVFNPNSKPCTSCPKTPQRLPASAKGNEEVGAFDRYDTLCKKMKNSVAPSTERSALVAVWCGKVWNERLWNGSCYGSLGWPEKGGDSHTFVWFADTLNINQISMYTYDVHCVFGILMAGRLRGSCALHPG